MSGTVGDKIALTVPTNLGDNNLWGGILNTLMEMMDEFVYAQREDRNLFFNGGDKISYDSATGNITFTQAIDIFNGVTSFKNSITTAASPTTLNATDKLAYCQITRKPGSNTNITALTVVSLGSLPNGTTDSDMGTFVFAYRTSDNTIIFPWAKREMLSGDVWRPNAQQSWYERILTSGKPMFYTLLADPSQVIVPGSAGSPSVVMIDGKMYANTANATCDLDTAGRNGLDTGAKAANTSYYLYAIPPASGRTFDVVCSVTAPTTGPTGFSSWSYIGAFATDQGAATVTPFRSVNGTCIYTDTIETETHTGGTTSNAETFSALPVTAKAAWMMISLTPSAANQSGRCTGISSTTYDSISIVGQVAAQAIRGLGWIPIFTNNTIYLRVSNAAASLDGNLQGWRENPMEYK